MSLKSRVVAHIAIVETTQIEGNSVRRVYRLEPRGGDLAPADGSSNDQFDLAHKDQRSLATGSEELDLTSLSGGTAAQKAAADNFANIKLVCVANTGEVGDTGHLLVGGAASTAWEGSLLNGSGDKVRVKPGGFIVYYDPEGGSTSSLNKLKFEAVTANQTYDLLLGGDSA